MPDSGILLGMVPMVAPMLAVPGVPGDNLRAYAVEPKLDGWRVIVRIDRDGARVSTRRGRVISDALTGVGKTESGCEAVLDGELVAAQGRAGDFYRVAPAVAARRPGLTLVVFDLLWLNGESLLEETYDARRARLDDLDLPAAITKLPRWPGTTAPHLFRACEEHGVEGIVLKRRHSRYRPGRRSDDWRKIKTALWFERHADQRHPK